MAHASTTEMLVALDERLWIEASQGTPAHLKISAKPTKTLGKRMPAHDNPALWLPGRHEVGDTRFDNDCAVVGISIGSTVIKGMKVPKSFAVIETVLPEYFEQIGEPGRYGVLIGRTAVNELALQVGMPPVYEQEYIDTFLRARASNPVQQAA